MQYTTRGSHCRLSESNLVEVFLMGLNSKLDYEDQHSRKTTNEHHRCSLAVLGILQKPLCSVLSILIQSWLVPRSISVARWGIWRSSRVKWHSATAHVLFSHRINLSIKRPGGKKGGAPLLLCVCPGSWATHTRNVDRGGWRK